MKTLDSSEEMARLAAGAAPGSGTFLNLAAWQERSIAAGPGERFILWVQGCPLRCPDCINSDFLADVPRHRLPVGTVADRILSVRGIEGVTFSGGEPTSQARGLVDLCERLRQHGLTIVCYSGFTLESLQRRRDPWITRLLGMIDILIDGPYLREQAASLLWRGSRNQRLHYLSPAYAHLAGGIEDSPARVELTLGRDEMRTTGNWPPGFLERLEAALRTEGP